MDPAKRGNSEEVQSLEILTGEALMIRALTSGKPKCG
jgi:hypothetical protein